MEIYGDLWGPMETHANLWGPIQTYGNSFFYLVCCFSTYHLCFAKVSQTFFITTCKHRCVNTTYHIIHQTSDLVHILGRHPYLKWHSRAHTPGIFLGLNAPNHKLLHNATLDVGTKLAPEP